MRNVSVAAGLALAAVSFVALLGAEPSTDEICAGGYAKAHRMPYLESNAIKRRMLPPGHSAAEYELDHIVPLCLGGSNNSSNLMLQAWNEARKKDELEIDICRRLCHNQIELKDAQALFKDWKESYEKIYGRRP